VHNEDALRLAVCKGKGGAADKIDSVQLRVFARVISNTVLCRV
jgi:hypothetical protein